jgi:thiamine biosynthesis protein ThiS
VAENISLPELVAELNLKPEQIAIELNQNVIRRAQWDNTLLQADDKVEIVHFVGGGCNQAQEQ